MFFHHNSNEGKTVRDSATTVADMILVFWDKARIPCKLKRNLIPAIEKLVDKYKKLRKNKENKQKRSKGLQEKEDRFSDDLDNLFDVAHANALSLIKIEEDTLFVSTEGERKKRDNGHSRCSASEK